MLRSLDWKKRKVVPMCVMYEHFVLPSMETLLNCRNNKHEPAMATQVAILYFWRFRKVLGENKFR
jgi:hypothetical protein